MNEKKDDKCECDSCGDMFNAICMYACDKCAMSLCFWCAGFHGCRLNKEDVDQ